MDAGRRWCGAAAGPAPRGRRRCRPRSCPCAGTGRTAGPAAVDVSSTGTGDSGSRPVQTPGGVQHGQHGSPKSATPCRAVVTSSVLSVLSAQQPGGVIAAERVHRPVGQARPTAPRRHPARAAGEQPCTCRRPARRSASWSVQVPRARPPRDRHSSAPPGGPRRTSEGGHVHDADGEKPVDLADRRRPVLHPGPFGVARGGCRPVVGPGHRRPLGHQLPRRRT